MYLREAQQLQSDAEQVRARLTAAADKLREAVAYQPENTIAIAQARLDLALVLLMLGEDAAASLYAREAVPAASSYLKAWTADQQRLARQLRHSHFDVPILWGSALEDADDPYLVWMDNGTSAEPKDASEALHKLVDETSPKVARRPRRGYPHFVTDPVAARSSQAGGRRRSWRALVTDKLTDQSFFFKWHRQQLMKRKLGLTILQASQHPVAVAEFRAIRRAAVRLGAFDYHEQPWFYASLWRPTWAPGPLRSSPDWDLE